MSSALASSTLRTYRSGANQYVLFCYSHRFTPFPASELFLCLFAVASANRNLSYRSIKVYLFGVQFHSLLHGFPIKISTMQYLYYVFRGIRRIQGNSLTRPLRNPITISHLWTMLAFLSTTNFTEHDRAMWHCVIVTAFFGLLRFSEYTCTNNFDQSLHLSASDISFNADFTMAYIRIKASKTDPFRTGCIIRLAAIPKNKLCPVTALRHYLDLRSSLPGPLFVFSNSAVLTRKFVVAFLGISLPGVGNINTHSFRIGGASATSAALWVVGLAIALTDICAFQTHRSLAFRKI